MPPILLSLLKAARPFHEAFGGKKFRLLQNVDDPARYVHEIEYETHEAIEFNRQRFASDPRVQATLQSWRTMLGGRSRSTSTRRSSSSPRWARFPGFDLGPPTP